MTPRGKLAELLVQNNPKLYPKHVISNARGDPILYARLTKALYGKLMSVLLFCKKLRGELEDMGFQVNPYDPCVANKMINRSQMTVC